MDLVFLAFIALLSFILGLVFINLTIPRRLLERINQMRHASDEPDLEMLMSGGNTAGFSPLARSMPGDCAEFPTGFQWGSNSEIVYYHGRALAKAWGKKMKFRGETYGTMELRHRWDSRFFSFMFRHKLAYRRYRSKS